MQRKKIEEFYKEYMDNIVEEKTGCWIVTGIFLFVVFLAYISPWQSLQDEPYAMWIYPMLLATSFYMIPYYNCKENNKTIHLYDKLRYLPIAERELKQFCIKKICRFNFVVFCVCFVEQVLFALVFYQSLTWGNFLYPFVCIFIIPVVVFGIVILYIN